jgi:hypothetical protein
MLYCPARLPTKHSKWFDGGIRKSSNFLARPISTILSWARSCISGGNLRDISPLKIFAVSLSANDIIIWELYHIPEPGGVFFDKKHQLQIGRGLERAL